MRYERSLAIAGRLDSLLELIRTGAYSTPTIAAKLGVCEQTIYRDILFLKQRGHSIRSRRIAGGWAYELLGGPDTGKNEEGASGT
jgi:biotin operon repressor